MCSRAENAHTPKWQALRQRSTLSDAVNRLSHLDLAEIRRVGHADGALHKATAALDAVVLDALLLVLVLPLLQEQAELNVYAGERCYKCATQEVKTRARTRQGTECAWLGTEYACALCLLATTYTHSTGCHRCLY